MCIVTIFSEENGDFILTQNRDESRLRPSSKEIETKNYNGINYTGPVDLHSGGTWTYYSDDFVVCVLNGAYKKHQHRPPYRKSRGLIILELMNYKLIEEFVEKINLNEIEPFTMIMLNRQNNEKKILVWDGTKKFVENHSKEKLIVRSSSTLYDDGEKQRHKMIFENTDSVNPEKIMQIHKEIKMNENPVFPGVITTSVTQIIRNGNTINLKFCPIS